VGRDGGSETFVHGDGSKTLRLNLGKRLEIASERLTAGAGRFRGRVGGADVEFSESVSAGDALVKVGPAGRQVRLFAPVAEEVPLVVAPVGPVASVPVVTPERVDLAPGRSASLRVPRNVGGSRRTQRSSSVGRRGVLSGSGLVFNDAFGPGSRLAYGVTPSAVKEAIVLDSLPPGSGALQYRFGLSTDGLVPSVRGNGAIEFADDNGTVAYVIPPGVGWDSTGGSGVASNRYSVVTVLLDGDAQVGWSLLVKPDMEWLRAADRVFPVFLDPSIEVGRTDRNNVANVSSGSPATAMFASGPASVGYEQGWAQFGNSATNQWLSYMRFDLSQVPAGATVNQAVLNTFVRECTSYQYPMSVKRLTTGWSAQESNLVVNGGFEVGTRYSTPSEWTVRNANAYRNIWGYGASSGRMDLVGSDAWSAFASSPFAVVGGETLSWSSAMYGSGSGSTVVRFEWYATAASNWGVLTDGSGGVASSVSALSDVAYSTYTNTWNLPQGTVAVPAGMKWGRMSFHQNTPGSFVVVDQVKVTRVSQGGLVANGDFDFAQSVATDASGWARRSGTWGTSLRQTQQAVNYEGLTSTGGWAAIGSTPFRVVPGETLQWQGTFVDSGSGTTAWSFEWYGSSSSPWDVMTDGTGGVASTLVGTPTPVLNTSAGQAWKNQLGDVKVPAGAGWARVNISFQSANGWLAVDNVNVTRPNPDPMPNSVTWNSRPAVDNGSAISIVPTGSTTFSGFDITPWVKGWLTVPASNFGVQFDMGSAPATCSVLAHASGQSVFNPDANSTFLDINYEPALSGPVLPTTTTPRGPASQTAPKIPSDRVAAPQAAGSGPCGSTFNQTIAGWVAAPGVVTTRETGGPAEGIGFLRVSPGGSGYGSVSVDLRTFGCALVEGQSYWIAAQMRAPGSSGGGLNVVMTEAGQVTPTVTTATLLSSAWQWQGTEFVATGQDVLTLNGIIAGMGVDVDDVRVFRTNRLPVGGVVSSLNPSGFLRAYDSGLVNDFVAKQFNGAAWVPTVPLSVNGRTDATGIAVNASPRLRLAGPVWNGGNGLDVWVKGDAGALWRIDVTEGILASREITTNGAWQHVTLMFRLPLPTENGLSVDFMRVSGGGSLVVDDMSVVQGPLPTVGIGAGNVFNQLTQPLTFDFGGLWSGYSYRAWVHRYGAPPVCESVCVKTVVATSSVTLPNPGVGLFSVVLESATTGDVIAVSDRFAVVAPPTTTTTTIPPPTTTAPPTTTPPITVPAPLPTRPPATYPPPTTAPPPPPPPSPDWSGRVDNFLKSRLSGSCLQGAVIAMTGCNTGADQLEFDESYGDGSFRIKQGGNCLHMLADRAGLDLDWQKQAIEWIPCVVQGSGDSFYQRFYKANGSGNTYADDWWTIVPRETNLWENDPKRLDFDACLNVNTAGGKPVIAYKCAASGSATNEHWQPRYTNPPSTTPTTTPPPGTGFIAPTDWPMFRDGYSSLLFTAASGYCLDAAGGVPVLLASGCTELTPYWALDQTPSSGRLVLPYLLVSGDDSRCLGSTTSGALTVSPCDYESSVQQWTDVLVAPQYGTQFSLSPAQRSDLCLTGGTPLSLSTCNPSAGANQRWYDPIGPTESQRYDQLNTQSVDQVLVSKTAVPDNVVVPNLVPEAATKKRGYINESCLRNGGPCPLKSNAGSKVRVEATGQSMYMRKVLGVSGRLWKEQAFGTLASTEWSPPRWTPLGRSGVEWEVRQGDSSLRIDVSVSDSSAMHASKMFYEHMAPFHFAEVKVIRPVDSFSIEIAKASTQLNGYVGLSLLAGPGVHDRLVPFSGEVIGGVIMPINPKDKSVYGPGRYCVWALKGEGRSGIVLMALDTTVQANWIPSPGEPSVADILNGCA
jgi:hypothetical protein